MQAKVHTPFKTLLPGETKNTTIREGDVLEGQLAHVAVDNGFASPIVARSEAPQSKSKKAAAPQGEGQ